MPARRSDGALGNTRRPGGRRGEVLRAVDRLRRGRRGRRLGLPFGNEALTVSMLTRCPNCGTTFRVTEQQLGAREGRVRCGRCDTQFDANSTLSADPVTRPLRDKPAPPTSGSMAVLLGTERSPTFDFGPHALRAPSRLWWVGAFLLLLV